MIAGSPLVQSPRSVTTASPAANTKPAHSAAPRSCDGRPGHSHGQVSAGASGFLLKDMPGPQLVSGIRAVTRGEESLAPAITRQVIAEFTTPAAPEPPAGYELLTDREREVFRLVARGRSNAEIADELVVSIETVKSHVARMLAKLGLRDRVHAVVAAYESRLLRPGSLDG